MLRIILTRVLTLAALGAAALPSLADEPTPVEKPNLAIGLINMGYLFERHPGLVAAKMELKADVERADTQVKERQEALKSQTNQLQITPKGDPNYARLETDIARKSSDLKLDIAIQRKEFMLREARMYHAAYEEVQQEVSDHAKARGLVIVLRFNSEPVDVSNPESVLMKVNSPIVFHDPNADITQAVLDRILAKHKAKEAAKPAGSEKQAPADDKPPESPKVDPPTPPVHPATLGD